MAKTKTPKIEVIKTAEALQVTKTKKTRKKATVEATTKTSKSKGGNDSIIRNQKGQIVVPVPQDTNKNGTAGRPTEYDPKYSDLLIEYFDLEPFHKELSKVTTTVGRDTEKTVEEFKEVPSILPTIDGFCRTHKIVPSTFYNWLKIIPEFSETFELAKAMQSHILHTNALRRNYDASYSKFAAVNLTTWRDKVEVTTPVTAEQILDELRNLRDVN